MNSDEQLTRRSLRDLVSRRVDVKWADFAATHPHLAAAVERTVIIDSAVERLADDPQLRQALDLAARDDATLAASEQAVRIVDQWIHRLLAL